MILSKRHKVFDIFRLKNREHLLKSPKNQKTQIFIENSPLKNQADGQPTYAGTLNILYFFMNIEPKNFNNTYFCPNT